MTWRIVERPGYFGKKRDQIQAGYDERYGKDNWRIAWQIGALVVERSAALMLYEDGYYHHLQSNPELLEELLVCASDVYDDAPSNVQAGFSYEHQETAVNHLHDVAIRRAVLRLGRWFKGSELVQIRHTLSTHPLSVPLSPGQVPFHQPELIVQPALERWWWQSNSVECFYQSNKILQVREN